MQYEGENWLLSISASLSPATGMPTKYSEDPNICVEATSDQEKAPKQV